ncbi:MAG TPA: FeoA family protein [Steroidobacteraceae bacterium]|nr:FeoA family protein [Steroidobacteraceae bacterium]
MSDPLSLSLSDLRDGDTAVVTGLGDASALGVDDEGRETLVARLRDLGFVPGAHCEVVARMWFGDPLAVRIGGSTFALRRVEAAAVRVERAGTRAAA